MARDNPSDCSTRELVTADYDAVVELWRRSEGVEVSLGDGDAREDIAATLARNSGLSRVALVAGRIVGAVVCGQDGRRGYLYHLAVDRAHRGRGIGRRLVAECCDALRRAGLKRVVILVAKDNPEGQAFWNRLGFEGIGHASPMGLDL